MGGIRECSTLEDNVIFLLCAALISESFCDLLLKDPVIAMQKGFMGQRFDFDPQERRAIASIEAENLALFTKEIRKRVLKKSP